MAIYAELLRFELKKIFLSKITILAIVVSTGMLLGIALINYLVVNPYDRGVYEREAALEGRALDDALLAELAAEAEEAGGLSGIGPDSPFYHLAGYISRMQGTYLTIGNDTESGTGNLERTAESVWQFRADCRVGISNAGRSSGLYLRLFQAQRRGQTVVEREGRYD